MKEERENDLSSTEKPIVLASRSPRRIELLTRVGLDFEIRPSEVEEPTPDGRPPQSLAIEGAVLKARDIAARFPDRIVFGADTIVCLADRVLNKPADPAEAREMLTALRGRWHTVITGLCIVAPTHPDWTDAEHTRVRMADFPDRDLEWYLSTGEPYDKAGGYAIQGEAARLVAEIDGDYFNVVGLPLRLFLQGLSQYRSVEGLAIPSPPERFA